MTGSTSAAFGPRDILGILRRRVWIIVVFVILGAIGGLGTFYVTDPTYEAKAMIKCQVPNLESALRSVNTPMHRDAITFATEEQVQRLHSPDFIQHVLTLPSMKKTAWFTSRKNDTTKQLEDLRKAFGATAIRNSPIVLMTMRAPTAGEAQDMLNTIREAWWHRIEQETDRGAGDKLGTLRERKDAIGIERRGLRDQRERLLQNAPPGWDKNVRTVVSDELGELRQERLILEQQLNYLQIQQQQWKQSLNEQGTSPSVIAAIEQDPYIRAYRADLSNLQNQISVLRNRLGDEHQQVRQIISAWNNMQDQINQRRSELEGQYARAQATQYTLDIEARQQQLEKVRLKFQELSRQQGDLDKLTLEAQEIDRKLQECQKEEELLDGRIAIFETAKDNVDRYPALRAGDVARPRKRRSPKLKVYLPGGIVMGALAAFLLIMVLEFMSDKIKTPTEIRRYLDVPLLGMIPQYDEDDEGQIQLEKVAALKPQALISEAYRQIWANLVFGSPSEKLRSILVTSGSAQCGKTTTALNLAITLAAQEKRVLIIDANFRRPALNKLFAHQGRPRGLSNVLVGQASAADVVHPSGITGLDVVDAGPLPPNPAVLLGSDRMQKFLDNQRQYYDHIVVDGPPTLLVSDARIMAGMLDGTLMVVRAGQTSRGVVNRMANELKANKVSILGTVLNGVKPRRGGYFGKAYQSYYDYLEAEPDTLRSLPEADDVTAAGTDVKE